MARSHGSVRPRTRVSAPAALMTTDRPRRASGLLLPPGRGMVAQHHRRRGASVRHAARTRAPAASVGRASLVLAIVSFAGTYGIVGSDECTDCPAGTYRSGATHYNLARACGADGLQPCSTQQSSTWLGVAERAVDGDVNTAYGGNSCSHTWPESSPWWMVDLGQVRAVRAVKIWNRADECCSWRLQDFDIRIGDAAASYSAATACFTNGSAPMTSPHTVEVECGGSGRYLYIGLPGRSDGAQQVMTLCEVEVYEGCNACPANADSPAGSDAVSDCTCSAGFEGPDGAPCSPCAAGYMGCFGCPTDQWPGAETYTRSSGGRWTKIWSHDITLMPDDGANWTLSLEAKNMGVIDREFAYAGCEGWLIVTIPATTTAWTVFTVSAQRCIGQGRLDFEYRTSGDGMGVGDEVYFRNIRLFKADSVPSCCLDNDGCTACPAGTYRTAVTDVDCLTGDGSTYAGSVSQTINGRLCQDWNSDAPHAHDWNNLISNYCRNPNPAAAEKPWCYTTDPDVRWEFCDIPVCTGATHYNLARACGADGLQPCSTQQSSNKPEDVSTGLHLADAAVDANYAVDWASDSCSRTNGGETYPWWMVDLGQVRSVRAVKIWNRGDDCCSWRLQGYEIWIGNSASSYSDNMRCHTGGTAPLSDPFTVTSACVGTGRYLFIGVPDLATRMNLCEVEVYEGCTACPANADAPAGSDAVSDCICNAGFMSDGAGVCEACGAGKYSNASGVTSESMCIDCGAGKYSDTSGAYIYDCIYVCMELCTYVCMYPSPIILRVQILQVAALQQVRALLGRAFCRSPAVAKSACRASGA